MYAHRHKHIVGCYRWVTDCLIKKAFILFTRRCWLWCNVSSIDLWRDIENSALITPHCRNLTDQFDEQLEGHSVERMYLRQRWLAVNKTILKPLGGQYVYVGFSRHNKISSCSAYMISEKAIRFRHLDYNPDRAQKLISSSMSRHLRTRNISSKSMHAFLSNLANRQTDRQTNTGENIYLLLSQRYHKDCLVLIQVVLSRSHLWNINLKMADQDDMTGDLSLVDENRLQERLRLSKKQRSMQLKGYEQYEKRISKQQLSTDKKSTKRSKKSASAVDPSQRNSKIAFDAGVLMMDIIARKDISECK